MLNERQMVKNKTKMKAKIELNDHSELENCKKYAGGKIPNETEQEPMKSSPYMRHLFMHLS